MSRADDKRFRELKRLCVFVNECDELCDSWLYEPYSDKLKAMLDEEVYRLAKISNIGTNGYRIDKDPVRYNPRTNELVIRGKEKMQRTAYDIQHYLMTKYHGLVYRSDWPIDN